MSLIETFDSLYNTVTRIPQIKALPKLKSLNLKSTAKAIAKALDEITKANLTHSMGPTKKLSIVANLAGIMNMETGNLLHMRNYGNLGAIINITKEERFNLEHMFRTGFRLATSCFCLIYSC